MKVQRLIPILFLLAMSCKDDQISPTQAQLTARKLESELKIGENQSLTGYTISTYSNNTYMSVYPNPFNTLTISGDGYIALMDNTVSAPAVYKFNLGQLKYYSIQISNNFKSLQLYF